MPKERANDRRKNVQIRRESIMETLLEMRQKLDEIDTQITELYEKRMEICGQVADYKIKN